jgi:hypothetical protein
MIIQVYCQVCAKQLVTKDVAGRTIVATVPVGVCPSCAERIREASHRAGYEDGYNNGYDDGDNRTADQEAAIAVSFDTGYDVGHEYGYYAGNTDGKVRSRTEVLLAQAMHSGGPEEVTNG